mmetsp:Transcript_4468/g.14258  ORF Transcript_4468/g.14258 Transcript_4468/m.14258 type:complete len:306 (-) Transcript_4468:1067-1984(-)
MVQEGLGEGLQRSAGVRAATRDCRRLAIRAPAARRSALGCVVCAQALQTPSQAQDEVQNRRNAGVDLFSAPRPLISPDGGPRSLLAAPGYLLLSRRAHWLAACCVCCALSGVIALLAVRRGSISNSSNELSSRWPYPWKPQSEHADRRTADRGVAERRRVLPPRRPRAARRRVPPRRRADRLRAQAVRRARVLQLQLLLRVRRRAVRFALRAVHVVLPSQGLGHRVFMLQDAAAALRQRPLLGPTHRRRGVRGGSHALALRGRPVRGPRRPVVRRESEPLLVVGRVGLRSVDGRPVPRAGRGPLK